MIVASPRYLKIERWYKVMENKLFADKSEVATSQARVLSKTGELTVLAQDLSGEVLKKIVNDETYRDAIIASQKSNDSMDLLLKRELAFENVDIEFLLEVEEDELQRMLKSQQSKRSRTKGMAMTFEVYRELMIAGICEICIRMALGKDKGRTYSKSNPLIDDLDYEGLAADHDKLARAIRNIQSKKSIAKSKAGFDEQSDYYQALLVQEAKLKALRDGADTAQISNIIGMIPDDVDSLDDNDARNLLETIRATLKQRLN